MSLSPLFTGSIVLAVLAISEYLGSWFYRFFWSEGDFFAGGIVALILWQFFNYLRTHITHARGHQQSAIALHQASQFKQVQQLNVNLEQQIRERTEQLQQALSLEARLKCITDKVRDSLDESQILQIAVQELALGLQVLCCDAALYDLQQATSTIQYEYTVSTIPAQGRVLQMIDCPELYRQLLQGQDFQFCEGVPHPARGRAAMLACPIVDDQGVLGDLWLFKPSEKVFEELEIRLVQQVANQCAIAIRQARLYQTAQAQVAELAKLNQLKDDFLSTVSHELRTPIANIHMAIQMLHLTLNQQGLLNGSGQITRYLQILQDECQRELHLINDLLDLQRLDAGVTHWTMVAIDLRDWLPHLVEPFEERARLQQQTLQLDVAAELPLLTTDLCSLERVMSELLNNACKYTPPGETITVIVQAQAGVVQISVCNSGVEISAQNLERMFDKFYRIPGYDRWNHGGTGLGLALVQKLIEHLGGSVKAASQNNQTCLHIILPLQSPKAPLAASDPSKAIALSS